MLVETKFAFDLKIAADAAGRWKQSAPDRDRQLNTAENEGIAGAESHDRLAKRATRLVRMMSGSAWRLSVSDALRPMVAEPERIGELSPKVLEQIIGESRDFLSVEFLERGWRACSAVCRTVSHLGDGRVKYGTGFLVSPRLLMTNHHVLATPDEASITSVEFNYQMKGGVTLPAYSFTLDPDTFFLSDAGLDFTIVAVNTASREGRSLSEFGYCPLEGLEGKIMVTEPANIIQHPAGRAKEVVVRQNRLLHLLPNFAQYEADTEPGSSGSPVFNDQWEVVALHHSGIPRTDDQGHFLQANGAIWHETDDPSLLAWVANEGIRVSVLVGFIRNAEVPAAGKAVRDGLLGAQMPSVPQEATSAAAATGTVEDSSHEEPAAPAAAAAAPRAAKPVSVNSGGLRVQYGASSVTVSVPLNVTITLGNPQSPLSPPAGLLPAFDEAAEIAPDPDYSKRPGYQADFLGFPAPLPKVIDEELGKVLVIAGAQASGGSELKYFHYSVIMNQDRKMAYVSAVNYSAKAKFSVSREGNDKWYADPRAQGFQTDAALYADNPLDRGHLTRRADSAWGDTEQAAEFANADTFHFTNCTPQHEVFNQGQKATHLGLKLWGNLESYVQQQAKSNTGNISVFNGPVFRISDRPYRDVLLPKEFWKMILYADSEGKPRAAAFILSQESLVKDLPLEEMVWTPYQPFQVKVATLEQRTHLDFGELVDADVLATPGHESFLEATTGSAMPINRLQDILL